MPQEDDGRRQLDHPEEVSRMPFPADDDAAEIVIPGEEPLDFPASPPTPQRPAILGARAPMREMGRDQFDVVGSGEMVIKPVTVVRPVADQSSREIPEETRGKGLADEMRFMW